MSKPEGEYLAVAKRSQLREGRSLRVSVGDEDVALWLVGGEVYALDNVCAHQHLPVIFRGTVEEGAVMCPMHGWRFSLRTGQAVAGQGRIRTFRVKVEGDDVLVERPVPLW
jgi:3-phenylpropionate/trans-cinnamate dioxygenase ferredoxin component